MNSSWRKAEVNSTWRKKILKRNPLSSLGVLRRRAADTHISLSEWPACFSPLHFFCCARLFMVITVGFPVAALVKRGHNARINHNRAIYQREMTCPKACSEAGEGAARGPRILIPCHWAFILSIKSRQTLRCFGSM